MNWFREIKYHANVLAVYCNNFANSKSSKLNSNKLTFMGKLQNIIPLKDKAFTVFSNITAILIWICGILLPCCLCIDLSCTISTSLLSFIHEFMPRCFSQIAFISFPYHSLLRSIHISQLFYNRLPLHCYMTLHQGRKLQDIHLLCRCTFTSHECKSDFKCCHFTIYSSGFANC